MPDFAELSDVLSSSELQLYEMIVARFFGNRKGAQHIILTFST